MKEPYLVRSHTFKTDEELQTHLNECYYQFGYKVISIFKDDNLYTKVSFKI